jgi:hypothetical protein
MTPIKPEDRPKLIALLAAVFVVFGYGAWQLFKPRGGGQPAPPAGPRIAKLLPAPRPPQNVPTPTKDIFRPIRPLPGAAPKKQAETPPKAPNRPAAGREDDTPPAGVPPTPDRKKTTEPDVKAPPKPTPLVPVVPQKRLELVGVVSGKTALAMILVNGREFFVRQGERLDRYHVARIGMDEVLLTRQNSRIVLRVGAPVGGGSPAAAGASAPVPTAAPAT